MEVVVSLSQGRTAAAQCGLFTYKSVPVIFEPPCICFEPEGSSSGRRLYIQLWYSVFYMHQHNQTAYTALCIVIQFYYINQQNAPFLN